MNLYKLPTQGKPYRGKYPTRLRFLSSGSREARLTAKFFSMQAPHHIELNDGSRYIIGGFDLHEALQLLPETSALFRVDFADLVRHAYPMTEAVYAVWLAAVKKHRAAWDSDHVKELIHSKVQARRRKDTATAKAIDTAIQLYVRNCVEAVGSWHEHR